MARGLVDHCGIRQAERVRSVLRFPQPNCRDRFVVEGCVLPRAHLARVVHAAWEQIVAGRTAAAPATKPVSRGRRPSTRTVQDDGLLLGNNRAAANVSANDDVANLDLLEIATTKLSVDREIAQRLVSQSALAIELETDRPNLLLR